MLLVSVHVKIQSGHLTFHFLLCLNDLPDCPMLLVFILVLNIVDNRSTFLKKQMTVNKISLCIMMFLLLIFRSALLGWILISKVAKKVKHAC